MRIQELYEKLKDKKVGIAGCGGLGSNVAQMLVRSGIRKLVLVDFDRVQESNLNRQFFYKDQIGQEKVMALRDNLLKIQPKLEIESHVSRLNTGLIQRLFIDCDILIEAFDIAESKAMLFETMSENLPNIPVIGVSGLAGMDNAEKMQIIRDGNLILIGDFSDDVSDELPPLAPKVTIAAALQANEALKILLR
ncbi:MAG: sulfur carrier protein ThiS adenylyltransferase ThiF [Bacteroidales bacterium]|nr:sulfur carrier protein ThiS adenylyltransferase ThiF [Bacteroidales bacterium]